MFLPFSRISGSLTFAALITLLRRLCHEVTPPGIRHFVYTAKAAATIYYRSCSSLINTHISTLTLQKNENVQLKKVK